MSDFKANAALADLKVLFVEDDHGVLDAIAKILGRYVGELYIATNGKEGLHIFSLYKPDIVVTDIKMPVMDGLKMAREIRKINAETPVVIVSAFNEAEYVASAIELGVCQYLFKPIELEQLLDALGRCAQNMLLRREVAKKTQELSAGVKALTDYKRAIDASAIVSKSNAASTIVEVNDAFCNAFGYSREEIVGKNYSIIRHPQESEDTIKAVAEAIKNKTIFKGIVQNVAKNGDSLYFNLTVAPIMDENGKVVEYLNLRQDITPIIMRRYIDDLTGYPNRNALKRDFENAPHPATILLNLEYFSGINDVYGNKIGDKVLIAVADVLRDHLAQAPGNAALYKLSADEYVVLAPDQSQCGGIREFTASILAHLGAQTFAFNGFDITIGAKAGYTLSKSEPIAKSDMALKIAKRDHKSAVCYEDLSDVKREFSRNVEWIAKIKKAINSNCVVPYFQPVIDAKTGAIVQYECLMRILDGEAIVEPNEFLSVSRKTRQYGKLSRIMIEKSCEYFAEKPYDFSLNMNVDDAKDEATRERLKRVLEKTGVARRLVVELSQTERIYDRPEVLKFIEELRAMGCRVAIDDYGVGYSSFRNLLSMRADFIKIDGSIVSNMDSDRNSLMYAEIISGFAEKLNVGVIAKYVRNEAIKNLVGRLGIGYAQGYFYAKPSAKIGAK